MKFKYTSTDGVERTFRLSFEYIRHTKGKHKNQPYKTIAYIHLIENGYPILLGQHEAVCMKGDQFDRRIGRKIALEKLLKGFNNREFRTALWNEYLVSIKLPESSPVLHE